MNYIDISASDELKPLVEQCADPYVYLHTDGYYYFTYSTPEYDRIELRRSWSLKGLALAKPLVIWRKHPSGPMSWHIWAPEIHFIDGKWFIYFAAGRAEDPWWIRTWVLENDCPDPFYGSWCEMGMMEGEWDSFMLDFTVFENRGKWYACWAQKGLDRTSNSDLYLAEMESPLKLKFPVTKLTVPEYEWECRGFKVNEGASVLKRNGKVFVSYSASATDASYCMGLLSADADADLTDPSSWKKSAVPVLVTDEKAGIYGPGHNSFTTSRDGKEDYLIYHARPYAEVNLDFALYDPNRHCWVKRIRYDENGFPVFQ